MKIAVLDFADASIDIIRVEESFVEKYYNGDVEAFLTCWCDYDTESCCQWLIGNDSTPENHFTIDDFAGDDELDIDE